MADVSVFDNIGVSEEIKIDKHVNVSDNTSVLGSLSIDKNINVYDNINGIDTEEKQVFRFTYDNLNINDDIYKLRRFYWGDFLHIHDYNIKTDKNVIYKDFISLDERIYTDKNLNISDELGINDQEEKHRFINILDNLNIFDIVGQDHTFYNFDNVSLSDIIYSIEKSVLVKENLSLPDIIKIDKDNTTLVDYINSSDRTLTNKNFTYTENISINDNINKINEQIVLDNILLSDNKIIDKLMISHDYIELNEIKFIDKTLTIRDKNILSDWLFTKWLAGWLYRKRIHINGVSGIGNGYQILFKIGESGGSIDYDFHLNGHSLKFPSGENDSGDIRFVNQNGMIYPMYVEKVIGNYPNRTAYVWVKIIDSLDSDLEIFCYYGNSHADNISDGNSVFEYFDTFSSDTLSNYDIVALDYPSYNGANYDDSGELIEIDTTSGKCTLLSPKTVSIENGRFYITMRIDYKYSDNSKFMFFARDHAKSHITYKISSTEGIDSEINDDKFVPVLVIFGGYQKQNILTTSNVIEPYQINDIMIYLYDNTTKVYVNNNEIGNATTNIMYSGRFGFGLYDSKGKIYNIFVAKSYSTEPTFTVKMEETYKPEIFDNIILYDVMLSDKKFSEYDTISITENIVKDYTYYIYDEVRISNEKINRIFVKNIYDIINYSEYYLVVKYRWVYDNVWLSDIVKIIKVPRIYLTGKATKPVESIGIDTETHILKSNKFLLTDQEYVFEYPTTNEYLLLNRGKEIYTHIILAVKNGSDDPVNVKLYFYDTDILDMSGKLQEVYQMALGIDEFDSDVCSTCEILLKDKRFMTTQSLEYDFDYYNETNPIITTINNNKYKLLYIRRKLNISEDYDLDPTQLERLIKIKLEII